MRRECPRLTADNTATFVPPTRDLLASMVAAFHPNALAFIPAVGFRDVLICLRRHDEFNGHGDSGRGA